MGSVATSMNDDMDEGTLHSGEDIRLGDGMYPAKAMKGPISRIDLWAEEHDPFVRGTIESTIWRAGLFNSQARLISQPRLQKWDVTILGVCCGLAMISYSSTLLSIILKIGTG